MASIGQELLNVPFPQMVESMGLAIAKAQHSLDMNSIRIAQVMSGSPWIDQDEEGNEVMREGIKVAFGGKLLSLLELGFTPTFYQFVDTVIEVKISISMKSETEQRTSSSSTSMSSRASVSWWSSSASVSASVSTVSASFAARTNYSAEGASLLRTKIVPLPPPAVLQERIRALLQDQKKVELEIDPNVIELVLSASGGGTAREITVSGVTLETPTVSKDGVVTATVTPPTTSPPTASPAKLIITPVAEGVVTVSVVGNRAGPPVEKLKGQVKVLVSRAKS